jgi:hypothetical protein
MYIPPPGPGAVFLSISIRHVHHRERNIPGTINSKGMVPVSPFDSHPMLSCLHSAIPVGITIYIT